MDKQIVKSYKTSNLWLLIVGAAGSFLASYFLIKNATADVYVDVLLFALGVAFGTLGIWSIKSIFSVEHLMFDGKKLNIFSITGNLKKSIELADIESFVEIKKENKYSKWKDLTLFTKYSKYTISQYSYSNYKSLKKALTKGKKKNQRAKKLWHYKIKMRYGFGFTTVGILFLLFFGSMYLKKDLEVASDQLVTIKATVDEVVLEGRNKGRRLSTSLALKEYPKFEFRVVLNAMKRNDIKNLRTNIEHGEQVELDILKEQYQKKLTKQIPLDFWDKSYGYRSISIYGLKDQQRTYYNLDQYNYQNKGDRELWGLYLMLGFSLFILGFGIYMLVNGKRPI